MRVYVRAPRLRARRHPLLRAYSAFSNARTNSFIQVGRCRRQSKLNEDPNATGPDVCDFNGWVDELCAAPAGSFLNEHFAPQVDYAMVGEMHYHHIFQLESAQHQDCFWRGMLGLKTPLHSNPSGDGVTGGHGGGGSSARPLDPAVFSGPVVARLSRLYAADLALWALVGEANEAARLSGGFPDYSGAEAFVAAHNATGRGFESCDEELTTTAVAAAVASGEGGG